jgi:hypothetical protein
MEFTNGVNVPYAAELGWFRPVSASMVVVAAGTAVTVFGGDHDAVLALPVSVIAVRANGAAAPQSRMSYTKFQALVHEVIAEAGVTLVSEALRLAGVDYTRHAAAVNLRAVCVPTATPVLAVSGHPVAVLPVVLLPLVVARAARWITAAQDVGRFRVFLERCRAEALAACANDRRAYELYSRLFLFVLSTPSWWGPLSPQAAYVDDDDDDDGGGGRAVAVPGSLDTWVPRLEYDTIRMLLTEMVVRRIYVARVRYAECTDQQAAALIAAINEVPGTPFMLTAEKS